MRRITALDGLRGVAVLAVLASHTLVRAHGGFLGVDVFFVLSGYLITTLLLRERAATGRIDFPGFYRRRAARLVPAYLLMLVLAVPMMAGPLAGQAHWPTALAVAASAGYVANWASVADVDALGPIVHTWSLSIEEQFYLIWPAAFVALCAARRSLGRWLGAGIVLIVLARGLGWALTHQIWPYFATVTHSDGLLAGALLAVLLHRRGEAPAADGERRISGLLAGGAVVTLAGLALVASVDSGSTYTIVLTLATAATVAVVRHLVVVPRGVLGRVLEARPLVAVGRVSYGLYLYHLPIFVLVQEQHWGFTATLLLEVGATSGLAAASWVWLERPVQRWAHRRTAAAPSPLPSSSSPPSSSLPSPSLPSLPPLVGGPRHPETLPRDHAIRPDHAAHPASGAAHDRGTGGDHENRRDPAVQSLGSPGRP